jgi:DNA-binding MarR family transcriptional regulator
LNPAVHVLPSRGFLFSRRATGRGIAMLARETVELLIQAARMADTTRLTCDLRPAEWMALRYFARANAYSRKASALADFEANSRAAVSHIISRLEQGGYLTRRQSQEDGRSFSLEVTAKGRTSLQQDPIGNLVQAVKSLPDQDRGALHDALREVLTGLAASGTRRQFDICRDCAHLIEDAAGSERNDAGSRFWCDLFHVAIEAEATKLLCAHFQPRSAQPGPSAA